MKRLLFTVASASVAIALAAGAGAQTRTAAGTATYWMSAETMSGFAAAAMGQQGGAAGIMGALLGGRSASQPAYVRNLTLQLGSPQRPSGTPEAAHLPPAGLGAGASLPLVTPQGTPPAPPSPNQMPQIADGQARGRILIYWGCGERARAGQPFEIDLARMSRGEVPAAMTTLSLNPMTPPSAASSATYGEWPNQRHRAQVPATGSLVGDHVVRGNYSPEIRFALAQGQDFLAPVNVTVNTPAASGAVPVSWQPVPNARAFFVMATGAREDGTIVMWTSSEVQAMQMAFDYLAPEEITRLLQQRVLLNPQTTQCTVPAEVAGSVEGASLMINAFGPEANFSHPARPANAPRNWAPDWAVKLRTRSTHMGMLGMDMAAMMRGESADEAQPQPERRRRRNPLGRIFGQ